MAESEEELKIISMNMKKESKKAGLKLNIKKNQDHGFPCGSADKESTCNVGDLGLIPELGRSPWRMANPLQYSGLENSSG